MTRTEYELDGTNKIITQFNDWVFIFLIIKKLISCSEGTLLLGLRNTRYIFYIIKSRIRITIEDL